MSVDVDVTSEGHARLTDRHVLDLSIREIYDRQEEEKMRDAIDWNDAALQYEHGEIDIDEARTGMKTGGFNTALHVPMAPLLLHHHSHSCTYLNDVR